MLKKKNGLIELILIFLCSFCMMSFWLIACATTPKGKLVETQDTFKALVKTYNMEMDLQQDEAVKQEWRETFPPLFEKMDKALKAYESAILQGFGADEKMQLVLLIKNQILLEFLRENIEFKDPEGEVK